MHRLVVVEKVERALRSRLAHERLRLLHAAGQTRLLLRRLPHAILRDECNAPLEPLPEQLVGRLVVIDDDLVEPGASERLDGNHMALLANALVGRHRAQDPTREGCAR